MNSSRTSTTRNRTAATARKLDTRPWIYRGTILLLTLAMTVLLLAKTTLGQSNATRPFVGFQSADGSRQSLAGENLNGSTLSSVGTNERYPYPAAGRNGYAYGGSGSYNQRYDVPTSVRLSSQMSRADAATGNLQRQPLGPSAAALPTSPSASAFSSYRAQPRIASLPSANLTSDRQASSSASIPTLAERPASQSPTQPIASAGLNQPVVQQTSSTIRGSQRTSVARAANVDSTNLVRVAKAPQSCVCVPVQNAQPNYANQVPTLAPNGAAGYNVQPGYQLTPGIGTPQFTATNNNVLTPFFRGSGVYTPLIPLVAPNPRTYLGQGIIGQPTAYVDGQPLRNLLRYISP